MDEQTARMIQQLKSNPAMLQALMQPRDGQALIRRFSRPVPSTARTSLHHGKAPSVGRLIIILYRLAICQQSAPIFIFYFFHFRGCISRNSMLL